MIKGLIEELHNLWRVMPKVVSVATGPLGDVNLKLEERLHRVEQHL